MASPPHFYSLTETLLPWLVGIFLLLLLPGLYGGLYLAPADYQQGDSYRIIYVHVPAAWMSLFIYMVMAVTAAIALVWRMKLAEVVMISSAPIGASFTFLALVTGSLVGQADVGDVVGLGCPPDFGIDPAVLVPGGYRTVRRDGRQTFGFAGGGDFGLSRRGQHPHHPLFRGMVEHLAPARHRHQIRQAVHPRQHVDPLIADGLGF